MDGKNQSGHFGLLHWNRPNVVRQTDTRGGLTVSVGNVNINDHFNQHLGILVEFSKLCIAKGPAKLAIVIARLTVGGEDDSPVNAFR